MEAKAILKYGHMGPRKARGVVDLIRGKGADEALNILKFAPQHAARVVAKLLKSAVANAAQKEMGEADSLWVSKAYVDGAPVLKRTQPRARGRSFLIRKRMSHITLVLSGKDDTAAKKKRAIRTGKG
ncbi:MAG: 50S ribosomal protein L22 [Nitrospirae bacterium]|nr:50S ribosomal protein L22 [Candidatus Troglogloeales bacterium]